MEPILEPDDVDLVISSGRWSDEVLAEVADFFRQCEAELPPLAVRDTASKVCNKSPDVIDAAQQREPNHVA